MSAEEKGQRLSLPDFEWLQDKGTILMEKNYNIKRTQENKACHEWECFLRK